MGEESYYIDKISEFIAENVLKPEEKDFNQSIVFGADISAAQIVDSAKGFPMMSEYRVLIVKESQNLKNTEPLEKYFKNPAKSTILVFCHKNGSIDKRKKIIPAALEGGAVIFESKKLYDRELPGFIESYLKKNRATIDSKTALIIAEHVGADLNRLTSELDKVLISLSDSDRRVTSDVVEKEIGVSKEFNTFELRNAIIRRDVFKANQIVKYFAENPKTNPIQVTLPLLFNFFSNLMLAYYAPEKSEQGVATQLGLKNTWQSKDYINGMRKYSGIKVMQIIGEIRNCDAKSKGIGNSYLSDGEILRELVYNILH